MGRELSKGRLYRMRSLYLFTAIVVGIGVWRELEDHWGKTHFAARHGWTLVRVKGVECPIRPY